MPLSAEGWEAGSHSGSSCRITLWAGTALPLQPTCQCHHGAVLCISHLAFLPVIHLCEQDRITQRLPAQNPSPTPFASKVSLRSPWHKGCALPCTPITQTCQDWDVGRMECQAALAPLKAVLHHLSSCALGKGLCDEQ